MAARVTEGVAAVVPDEFLDRGSSFAGSGSSHLSFAERFCFQYSHTFRALSVRRISTGKPFISAKRRAPGPTSRM